MATKPFRSSVGNSPVQAWALPNASAVLHVYGGLLAYEIGTAVGAQAVAALLNGTAVDAGTIAFVPLGGSPILGQSPAVPFSFGEKGQDISGAGGLSVKLIPSTIGVGTVSGYFHGFEQVRR